ncbi:substrate-binding periplasmic protein [Bdellovibrio sp. HCB2-146]|uniref:substrate-binding periplasmic protein n=1 Tax=Bdellovibrio sp. HCB2-146 TaxID=3394362 RepID=UPI0039BCC27F
MRPFFKFLCSGLFVLSVSVASAQTVISNTPKKCSHVFKAGQVFNEPLYFVSTQRQLRGSSIEVIHELRKRTGCEFLVEEYSRPSLIEKFRHSQVDISVVSVKTIEMDNVARFIHLYDSPRSLVVGPKWARKVKSVPQFVNKKKIIFGNIIGTQTYYDLSEYELLRKEKRLIDLPDYPSLFKALEENRIQGFIGSFMISSYHMNKMGLKNYSTIVDDKFSVPIGCYIDPKRLSEQEVQMFRQVLLDMLKDGTFVKIYSQFIPLELAQKSIIPISF